MQLIPTTTDSNNNNSKHTHPSVAIMSWSQVSLPKARQKHQPPLPVGAPTSKSNKRKQFSNEMLDSLSRREPCSDTAAENIKHGGTNEELLECMLAAPGVDDGRPFGDALSALGLEGWLRWGPDFQGFRQPVLDGEAGGAPGGDPGAGWLGRRALAARGVDGGRPFGDRVQCRRPRRLAALGGQISRD